MNTTSVAISRENIDVLANLTIKAIEIEEIAKSGGTPAHPIPEANLAVSAAAALHDYLGDVFGAHAEDDPEHDRKQMVLQGIDAGFSLGLGVAVAVATHSLDSEAMREAVKAELRKFRCDSCIHELMEDIAAA